jgi:hypothetical protein
MSGEDVRAGRKPGPLPSVHCGTVSAYKRHLRWGFTPCGPCKAAWAAYHRDRYNRKKGTT